MRNSHLGKETKMETTYRSKSENVVEVCYGDEVVEEYESCGCTYADLGMCQGCPECRIYPDLDYYYLEEYNYEYEEDYRDEDEDE